MIDPMADSSAGFVGRELNRIAAALRQPQLPERYVELYAAQQALQWSLDPDNFASPFTAIQEGRVQPLMGTQGD